MSNSYIKFSSITYAQMGKEVLAKAGIPSSVGRNTNPNRRQGCNFAVYVDGRNLNKAYNLIQNAGIKNMGYERGEKT